MLPFLSGSRDIHFSTVVIRMLFACLCGAVIGLERSSKNRPAGFRTHMLVSIGAAAASLTGHYLYLNMHMPADISRLGGQVITGLGFIGAGTIVVTRKQTVKGLTTAAGLWTTGIIGLAIGAGFYEGAVIAAALVILIETVFSDLGHHIRHYPEFRIQVEYNRKGALDQVMRYCKDRHLAITGLQIIKETPPQEDMSAAIVQQSEPTDPGAYSAALRLRPNSNLDYENLLEHIRDFPGVISAELSRA